MHVKRVRNAFGMHFNAFKRTKNAFKRRKIKFPYSKTSDRYINRYKIALIDKSYHI